MWTRAIIATAVLLTLATAPDANARASRRTIHIHADTVVIHPRAIHSRVAALQAETIVLRGVIRRPGVRLPKSQRPTRAALIACQMGPNFLGAAYRGKRYRPYTRTGRPRICLTGSHFIESSAATL